MRTASEIEDLLAKDRLDEAIELLDENVVSEPGNANWWYLRGKAYWRLGQRRNSIVNYEEAAHLDPRSPAVHALEMINDILDYYNPDLLNP